MLSKSSIPQEHSPEMAGLGRAVNYVTWNNPGLGIMTVIPSLE